MASVLEAPLAGDGDGSMTGQFVKGSWEVIFRVTDDFYSMKGGMRVDIASR